ncbi:MAG: DUF1294 domain-containing protein [Lachnospiraceae bacterium]|nr:DUF1294 domain-containing protein [Lachnospiraceae bacterium]
MEWINDNKILIIVYLAINLVVFFMYGIDKFKAVHNKWRIPENTLISGALFGVFGALLGMIVFHHKIRKPKFFITVPAFMIVEVGFTVYLMMAAR